MHERLDMQCGWLSGVGNCVGWLHGALRESHAGNEALSAYHSEHYVRK
jgi:hypothetical protein